MNEQAARSDFMFWAEQVHLLELEEKRVRLDPKVHPGVCERLRIARQAKTDAFAQYAVFKGTTPRRAIKL